MSSIISTISTNFMKKTIPLYSLNSTTTKTPLLSLSHNAISKRNKNKSNHYKPNFVSLVAQLLVTNQSNPPEFPSKPNHQPSFVPQEVPEIPKIPEIDPIPPEVNTDPDPPLSPNRGPDFPVPPMPSPPDPDYPKPMPPDVVPPNDVPPPLSPPDIPPPPGGPPIVF